MTWSIDRLLIVLVLCTILSSCSETQNASKHATESTVESELGAEIHCSKAEMLRLVPEIRCTGQIKPDFGKEYLVSVRLPGRILKILVQPGDYVKQGDTLGFVDSQQISEIQAQAIEASSRLQIAKAHEERERCVYEEELVRPKALILARSNYQRAKVNYSAVERDFARTQSLYKEKIAAQKDYLHAKSALEEAALVVKQAESEKKREEELFRNKALIKKDWQLAHAETERCQNELNMIKERLRFLGVDPDLVGDTIAEQKINPMLPIIAPASGTVVQQLASLGAIVDSNESIFSICNMKKVAIICELPEADLDKVKTGSPIKATVTAYGERQFNGKIVYVGAKLDPKTRTIPARALLDNSEGLLKLNMFAKVTIQGEPRVCVACHRDAIHEGRGKTVVYVRSKNGKYSERVVKDGIVSGDQVEIVSGLKPGESVVTEGGVLVKAELSMEQAQ